MLYKYAQTTIARETQATRSSPRKRVTRRLKTGEEQEQKRKQNCAAIRYISNEKSSNGTELLLPPIPPAIQDAPRNPPVRKGLACRGRLKEPGALVVNDKPRIYFHDPVFLHYWQEFAETGWDQDGQPHVFLGCRVPESSGEG